jgi:hypothetical protein
MLKNKDVIDNFVAEMTELSRKHGIAVHGFDGGTYLSECENTAHILCEDGDFWWNEEEKKYEMSLRGAEFRSILNAV